MSKKIYIGLLIGIATGAAISVLMKYKDKRKLFDRFDSFKEDDLLDKANHYLLLARNKVDEMVKEAEKKSSTILGEASKLLSLAKEKTTVVHKKISEGAKEEAERIKNELNKSIENFRKTL